MISVKELHEAADKLRSISLLVMTWWKEHRNDVWTEEIPVEGTTRPLYKDRKTYADGPPGFVKIAANVIGEKL